MSVGGIVTPILGRTLKIVRASSIAPRPVRWLWEGRVALGALSLIGGREGIGKSICAYTLIAEITRGRLPGNYYGTSKAAIVAATEDSWSHTIVPRLMGAGADLTRVYRVDVETADGADAALSLPRDLSGVEDQIRETRSVVMLLDPLLSRLDAGLDTHKDAEVRQGLEPLTAVAARTDCAVLGLIHVNKSATADPLTQLMASRAFAAVARTVLFVMQDPENEQMRLLGLAKNNLGRSDLPTLAFTIEGIKVADTDEGPVWTGKLLWTGESERSIHDALQVAVEARGENRTAVSEAGEWLEDYLTQQGGAADSAEVKRAGTKAGHTKDALHRARTKLQIATVSVGFPRRTHWMLSSAQSSDSSRETATTQTTQTTAANRGVSFQTTGVQLSESSESSELLETPHARATTDRPEDADVAAV